MKPKKVKKLPRNKNGPNGISDFIVIGLRTTLNLLPGDELNFLKSMYKSTMIAPVQKESAHAEKSFGKPTIIPRARANLLSPRPIHRPRDTSQSKKKNRANTRPASKEEEKPYQLPQ